MELYYFSVFAKKASRLFARAVVWATLQASDMFSVTLLASDAPSTLTLPSDSDLELDTTDDEAFPAAAAAAAAAVDSGSDELIKDDTSSEEEEGGKKKKARVRNSLFIPPHSPCGRCSDAPAPSQRRCRFHSERRCVGARAYGTLRADRDRQRCVPLPTRRFARASSTHHSAVERPGVETAPTIYDPTQHQPQSYTG